MFLDENASTLRTSQIWDVGTQLWFSSRLVGSCFWDLQSRRMAERKRNGTIRTRLFTVEVVVENCADRGVLKNGFEKKWLNPMTNKQLKRKKSKTDRRTLPRPGFSHLPPSQIDFLMLLSGGWRNRTLKTSYLLASRYPQLKFKLIPIRD